MSIVVPSVGACWLLDSLMDSLDPWVHLYVAAVDLDTSTTVDDLTEASWPDYAPQRAVQWTPALWATDRAYTAADPLVWVYGLAYDRVQVYGYYVTDGQAGPLLWVESDPNGPTTLQLAADLIQVFPRLTLRQEPAPS